MKWKKLTQELKEVFSDVEEVDSNTIYMENYLVRIIKKNRNKVNVYFHANINPSFSAEIGIILTSMQVDFNFEIESFDVFYYTDNSFYRGKEALKKSEDEKAENVMIDYDYLNLLENLDEDQMFKV